MQFWFESKFDFKFLHYCFQFFEFFFSGEFLISSTINNVQKHRKVFHHIHDHYLSLSFFSSHLQWFRRFSWKKKTNVHVIRSSFVIVFGSISVAMAKRFVESFLGCCSVRTGGYIIGLINVTISFLLMYAVWNIEDILRSNFFRESTNYREPHLVKEQSK